MRTEVISIETDTTPLDGLFYLPEVGDPRGVVQLLHGNTMNFYVGPPRFLPLTSPSSASPAWHTTGAVTMCCRIVTVAIWRAGHSRRSNSPSRTTVSLADGWMFEDFPHPSLSVIQTVACWPSVMWSISRIHRVWCCSRPTGEERPLCG